jgi:hypothetical protein
MKRACLLAAVFESSLLRLFQTPSRSNYDSGGITKRTVLVIRDLRHNDKKEGNTKDKK